MARQLQSSFGVPCDKMKTVYLGVDAAIADAKASAFVSCYGLKEFVLQVGRISTRKGQARLIRAMRGTNLPLVFVGPLDGSDPVGCREFLKLVEANSAQCHFLGPIYQRDVLYGAYHAARVHVLPSIGEFPGLVNLEAALGRATVVAGDAPEVREYLGELPIYCDPLSLKDIRSKVLAAWERPQNDSLRDLVLRRFTWAHTSAELVKQYESAMKMA